MLLPPPPPSSSLLEPLLLSLLLLPWLLNSSSANPGVPATKARIGDRAVLYLACCKPLLFGNAWD